VTATRKITIRTLLAACPVCGKNKILLPKEINKTELKCEFCNYTDLAEEYPIEDHICLEIFISDHDYIVSEI
jgi:transcription elongation factor Elf1